MSLTNNSFTLDGLDDLKNNPPVAVLVRAEIRDGIGMVTEIDIEFYDNRVRGTDAPEWDCEAALGETLGVCIEIEAPPDAATDAGERWFSGVCIEICRQHDYGGKPFYFASLRAWPWYLAQKTDCRIFQNVTARKIIEDSLADALESLTYDEEYRLPSDDDAQTDDTGESTAGLQPALPRRAYRVQYRESVFDFLYRVMADDGLNFYMAHERDKQTMVVFDELARLGSVPDVDDRTDSVIGFAWHGHQNSDPASDASEFEGLYEFHRNGRLWSGRVALGDYDSERADVDLRDLASSSTTSTMLGATYDTLEKYDYPGRFIRRQGDTDRAHRGEERAKFKMYRLKTDARIDHAAGNTRRIVCGRKFWIGDDSGPCHVARRAVYRLQIDAEEDQSDLRDSLMVRRASLPPLTLPADLAGGERLERYRVDLELIRIPDGETDMEIPLPEPKRPVIPGIQTATVVGTGDKPVETDAFGRIRVRFHWDRNPEDDEKASCWVRTVMPWTGNGYGAIMVPRVGQEVVVQFEEGDPDRPIVAGMLYNSLNAPPDATAFPQETSVGIISGSLGGDDLADPSMLIFDNTADEERVLFQAHRNLYQTVLKDMDLKVGADLTIDVENNTDIDIGGALTLEVEGLADIDITGALTFDVDDNATIDVTKKLTLKVKDLEVQADNEIKLSVGDDSYIKITGAQITLKSGKIRNNP